MRFVWAVLPIVVAVAWALLCIFVVVPNAGPSMFQAHNPVARVFGARQRRFDRAEPNTLSNHRDARRKSVPSRSWGSPAWLP